MMIEELLKKLSLDDTVYNRLLVGSAVEWINTHTTLSIAEDASDIPDSALLFILKYRDVLKQDKTIASESAQGLSQSFNTSQTLSVSLYEIASELLAPYLVSTVKVVAGTERWTYGG